MINADTLHLCPFSAPPHSPTRSLSIFELTALPQILNPNSKPQTLTLAHILNPNPEPLPTRRLCIFERYISKDFLENVHWTSAPFKAFGEGVSNGG